MEDIAGGNVIVKTLAQNRFSASSTFPSYHPHTCTLNGPSCWLSGDIGHFDKTQYLQLDLGERKLIHGLETQGHRDSWCATLRIDLSTDNNTWFNDTIVYKANTNPHAIANIKLKKPRDARYLRVYPQSVGGKNNTDQGGRGKLRLEVFWTEAAYIETKHNNAHATQIRPILKKQNGNGNDRDTTTNPDHVNLPEGPPTVVTLCTELVRLRGGPYWSESYALLRAPSRVTSSGQPGRPHLCVVDHVTDGGRWILMGSYQSDRPFITNHVPKIAVGYVHTQYANKTLQKHMAHANYPSKSYVCDVNSFGFALGADFKSLTHSYGQHSVVDEVRVFGCSLDSQRVVHYKTSDRGLCKQVLGDLAAVCRTACEGAHALRPTEYHPLPGHHRFGTGHRGLIGKCYDQVALHSKCCAIARLPARCHRARSLKALNSKTRDVQLRTKSKDVAIGLVWVRMRKGIVVATDPNDPSFLVGAGHYNPTSGGGEAVHKKAPRGSLGLVRQDTYDVDAITMMARPQDVAMEVQKFELRKESQALDVEPKELKCFHCEGTGLRWKAVHYAYGEQAGEEAKSEDDRTQHNRQGERKQHAPAPSRNEGGPSFFELGLVGAATLSNEEVEANAAIELGLVGATTLPNEEMETKATSTREAAYIVVPINGSSGNTTLDRNLSNSSGDGEQEDSNIDVPTSLGKCWVCRGTGLAAGTLPGVFQRVSGKDSGGDSGEDSGERKTESMLENISHKMAWPKREPTVEEEDEDLEDDEVCEICWCDPPKFGISTSCTHFFCVECIQGHLKQVLNSGEFPGYCPMCQANAPKGQTPAYGKIDGKAMTFLQRAGVISKEFQFQFMRKQNKDEQLFFECPAKCGNFLIDVDPTYVLRDSAVAVKTERCPCGQGVCVQCHQLVPEEEFYTHRCPEAKANHSMDDAATMATMKKLGKKCPHCAMFIIKNAGCDIMMCGDKAHGDLRKAIKAGGCGQTFKWSNLAIIKDNITNFQGQRVKCNPTIKYAKEIAAEKQKLGILMSDEETKVAELNLDDLQVDNKDGAALIVNARVDDPIDLRRPVLEDGRVLLHGIRERDPFVIMNLAVIAYNLQPIKKRIDVDKRYWENGEHCRQIVQPGGLFFLLAYTPINIVGFLYGLIRTVFKTIVWLLGCLSALDDNKTTMFLHVWASVFWVMFYVFLMVLGEGPLYVLCIVAIIHSIFFTAITNYLDNASTYNTPLTQACIHGQPDVLRLLLLHGADPNRTASSLMTPLVAAYLHGSWQCMDVLESTYDQQLGHYNHPLRPYDPPPQNWMTTRRLTGNHAFNAFNGVPEGGCHCTPRCCGCCFCRCRPPPRNEVDRRRRRHANHRHNRDCFAHVEELNRIVCLLGVWLVFLVYFSIHFSLLGYVWRPYIPGFEWDEPAQYYCNATAKYNPNAWNVLQYVRVGSRGFIGSHSDVGSRLYNVDFDFRSVGRQSGYDYINPHPMRVDFNRASRPHATYCPAPTPLGGIACVKNCMPCDQKIKIGAVSCDWQRTTNLLEKFVAKHDTRETSWNKAKQLCESTQTQLCARTSLCLNYQSALDPGLPQMPGKYDDTWVPVSDGVDEWVQLGKKSRYDTCQLHSEWPAYQKDPHPCGKHPDTTRVPDEKSCGGTMTYCCTTVKQSNRPVHNTMDRTTDRMVTDFVPTQPCNVPVHDTSCKSSYFLSGAFSKSPVVPRQTFKYRGSFGVYKHSRCRKDICIDKRCCGDSKTSTGRCLLPGYEAKPYRNNFAAHVPASPAETCAEDKQYQCCKRTQVYHHTPSERTLALTKIRVEVFGGTCNTDTSATSVVEFGLNVVLGASRYQPTSSLNSMGCLSYYFQQPSLTHSIARSVRNPYINYTVEKGANCSAEVGQKAIYDFEECQHAAWVLSSSSMTVIRRTFSGPRIDFLGCFKNQHKEFQYNAHIYSETSDFLDQNILFNSNFSVVCKKTLMSSNLAELEFGSVPIVDKGAGGCSTSQKCTLCQGDCDKDDDCADGLSCFQRGSSTALVPGCGTTGYAKSSSDHDYCYDTRTSASNRPVVETSYPTSFETYDASQSTVLFADGGCGWVNLTNTVANNNVQVVPNYMYTSRHGWILTNKIVANLSQDPGPGVVFASSFYEPNATKHQFDYCNGNATSSSPRQPLATVVKMVENVRLSVKFEPLEPQH